MLLAGCESTAEWPHCSRAGKAWRGLAPHGRVCPGLCRGVATFLLPFCFSQNPCRLLPLYCVTLDMIQLIRSQLCSIPCVQELDEIWENMLKGSGKSPGISSSVVGLCPVWVCILPCTKPNMHRVEISFFDYKNNTCCLYVYIFPSLHRYICVCNVCMCFSVFVYVYM